MEKNTVILDIVRYNALMEAEKKANEPKKHTVVIRENANNYWNPTANTYTANFICHTDNDAVKELADELKSSLVKIDELENKVTEYRMKYPETETKVTVEALKKFSILQLIKWKFKK